MNKELQRTKRGDGTYNVLLSVDGEQHMLCGISDDVDHIQFIKDQNNNQAKEELKQTNEQIKQWKGQEVMLDDKGKELISQKDIDDKLLELYGKKEVLMSKVKD